MEPPLPVWPRQKGKKPMSESPGTSDRDGERSPDFFDQLIETAPREQQGAFTVGFRGYDKAEVDAALSTLRNQLKQAAAEVARPRPAKRKPSRRCGKKSARLAKLSRAS